MYLLFNLPSNLNGTVYGSRGTGIASLQIYECPQIGSTQHKLTITDQLRHSTACGPDFIGTAVRCSPLVYLQITMPYHITLLQRTRVDTKPLNTTRPTMTALQHTNQIRLAMMFAWGKIAGREIDTRLRCLPTVAGKAVSQTAKSQMLLRRER